MSTEIKKIPIGIQSFESLISSNYLYIDKTELIYNLVKAGEVYFLSRPRRFGKSLLLSTLKAYFQGKQHLFKGLAMESLEKDWIEYPVFHISFAREKYLKADDLLQTLGYILDELEEEYGVSNKDKTIAKRFLSVIKYAYKKTGRKVVILIDEYDSPILDSINNKELNAELRGLMRQFFSPLKDAGEYLKFLLLTGISKFSQMSIFSELNNLQNISMLPQYSALCGITEEEMRTQFRVDIEALAEKTKKLMRRP